MTPFIHRRVGNHAPGPSGQRRAGSSVRSFCDDVFSKPRVSTARDHSRADDDRGRGTDSGDPFDALICAAALVSASAPDPRPGYRGVGRGTHPLGMNLELRPDGVQDARARSKKNASAVIFPLTTFGRPFEETRERRHKCLQDCAGVACTFANDSGSLRSHPTRC